MNNKMPYWMNHEAYCAHYPLAEVEHDSGKWELFRVTYKPTLNYEGGDFHEIYWDGELSMDSKQPGGMFISNPSEMLQQFIEFLTTEQAAV